MKKIKKKESYNYPTYDGGGRVEKYYMGGMVDDKMYEEGGMITEVQQKKLEKHSKHHSKKHMNEMKKDMQKGDTFAESHNKAMKKVGK